MMRADLRQIAEWLGATQSTDRLPAERLVQGVSTDTRTIKPGNLFIALHGARFDGHDHLDEAQANGAVAAIVARVQPDCALPQILVADTLRALQTLGARWRAVVNPVVIAITGSAGKTTVKQLLAAMFAQVGTTRATVGNLNNDIGVPLTLLALEPADRFAVIELGANHVGEIARLTALVRPDFALVTMAGSAHVGEFGSVDAIVQAKGELYTGLTPSARAVINLDSYGADVWQASCAAPWQGFALNPANSAQSKAQWQGFYDESSARLTIKEAGAVLFDALSLPLPGAHNATNLLAAISLARAAGLSSAAIAQGLSQFVPPAGRMSVRKISARLTLIDDSYNANPESMRAALQYLAGQTGLKLAVLGDMGELGDAAPSLHRALLAAASQLPLTGVCTLGAAMAAAVAHRPSASTAPWFKSFATHEALAADLADFMAQHTAEPLTLLLKGSRFMQVERVLSSLNLAANNSAEVH